MTTEYLESSTAVVYAVKTPQTKMSQYANGRHAHIQVDLLDAAERFDLEW